MSMDNWIFYSDDIITCTNCLKDYQAGEIEKLLTPCPHCGHDKIAIAEMIGQRLLHDTITKPEYKEATDG